MTGGSWHSKLSERPLASETLEAREQIQEAEEGEHRQPAYVLAEGLGVAPTLVGQHRDDRIHSGYAAGAFH